MDTGQANNNTFAAVARHFPVGDPNDLHVMARDGMHLRAICSERRTNCRPGNVWGAMVRLPFEWRPGTTLKVRYRSPKGDHSWAPIWMFTGQQISPGPRREPLPRLRHAGRPLPRKLRQELRDRLERQLPADPRRGADRIPS